MILFRRLLAALLLLGTVAVGQTVVPALAAPSPQPSVESSPGGVALEWRAPALQLKVLPEGRTRLAMTGYSLTSLPGTPRLPFTAALLALPPGSQPSIEIRRLEQSQQALSAPLEVAWKPEGVVVSPDNQVIGGAFAPAAEEVPFDPAPVVLEPLGILRGVQLARLVFYPVRPSGDHLLVTSYLQVAVHFHAGQAGYVPKAPRLVDDPLLSVLKPAVINPEQLEQVEALSPNSVLEIQTPGHLVAVEVDLEGLTAITYEALAAAGSPLAAADPHVLNLSRAGADIAVEWEGDEDAVFEPGERLLFYAQPRFSRWTATDVYFLGLSGTPSPAIPSQPADPVGLPSGVAWVHSSAELNRIYTPDCLCAPLPAGHDGDRWVWDRLQVPSRVTTSYSIDLAAVDPGQVAQLDVWLIGFTNLPAASPDHSVNVSLNGFTIGNLTWDGKQAVQGTFTVPGSVLQNGSNTLSLSLPGLSGVSVEGAWLDAFSITYGRSSAPSGTSLLFQGQASAQAYSVSLESGSGLRAYDVTDPDHPLRLTGFSQSPSNTITLGDSAPDGANRFWVTSEAGILSPAHLRPVPGLNSSQTPGADYLVITPAEFTPALEPLIALRQSQQLSVAVEHVQAIYDAYGDGRPDPAALRAFLAHAYATWDPRPAYVLLAGDGTTDPKRYNAASSATFIPPYLAEVDPWAGETAADNRYVTVHGDDLLPDMLIGRLPVNSLAEVQAVVAKIVQYELDPVPGVWSNTAIFVADDPDSSGDFPALSESLAASFISPPRTPRRFFYTPATIQPGELRQGLLEAWQQGAGLLTYIGHSSPHQWAAERFLHSDDAGLLGNQGRLPVVLELTCFTGSFQLPASVSVDEALLRAPYGGAVAVWGSTGLGVSTGHAYLAQGFMGSLLQQGDPRLGAAALAGKLRLSAANINQPELIDTFTLLGDPATSLIEAVEAFSIHLPLLGR